MLLLVILAIWIIGFKNIIKAILKARQEVQAEFLNQIEK